MNYSYPVYIFLMEKQWKFLLNTKIAYDLSVRHDFDLTSFRKVQGYLKKKCIQHVNRLKIYTIDLKIRLSTIRTIQKGSESSYT